MKITLYILAGLCCILLFPCGLPFALGLTALANGMKDDSSSPDQ